MILTDTSILIDYLRKRPDAIAFVEKAGKATLAINTVIAMELYQGALNKQEFVTIQKQLQGFFMLPVNEPVSKLALQLAQTYALSHHIGLPDAFIAATALIYDIELLTYNVKDFRFIPRLRVSNSLIY